ncbi:MAG: thermonuclease family protein [Gemmatimonadota bacterium]
MRSAAVPAKHRRRAVIGLTALLAFPPAACAQVESSCVVERVSDGDSITCGGERVRLLSIDAPELDQGPFGRAARAFLEAALPVGSHVRLVLDIERRDQHGRLLAYVYRGDGRMVNRMMARQGFALPLVVPPNVRHVEAIRAAADSARQSGVGLWAIDAFECSPADHRARDC